MFKFIYSAHHKEIFCLLLIITVLIIFYFPILENLNSPVNNSDYQKHYYQMGFLRKAVVQYKQLPLRNPFLSGGYPVSGALGGFIFNPLNLFILLFGEVPAVRLSMFCVLICSALSMFYLTKVILKYSCTGSAFSVLTFMFSGFGVFHVVGGDYEKLYFYLLPLLVAFFIKAETDRRFVVLAGLILGLIFVNGGLIIIPVGVFLFVYVFLHLATISKDKTLQLNISCLYNFILIILFAGLLYAVKIIPMINLLKMRAINYVHFAGEHSYAVASQLSKIEGYALNLVSLQSLLLNKQYAGYGKLYLGIIPIFFFLLSSFVFFKKHWRYLLILLIFIILSFGSNSYIDLFKILWNIHPFVHGIWKLNKYFAFPILFIISLIGGNLFSIPGRTKRYKKTLKLILFIIGLIGVSNMFKENKKDLKFAYVRIPEIREVGTFFQVRVKDYKVTGPFDIKDISDEKFTIFYWLSMLQGFGVANCILGSDSLAIVEHIIPKYFIDNKKYDEIRLSANTNPMRDQRINPFYKGELFLEKNSNCAKFEYFSPNKLNVFVNIKDLPDILVINQRYDAGWRCNMGRLRNCWGLLGIEIDKKGIYTIQMDYLPKDFLLGLSISFLTLVGAFVYWNKYGKDNLC